MILTINIAIKKEKKLFGSKHLVTFKFDQLLFNLQLKALTTGLRDLSGFKTQDGTPEEDLACRKRKNRPLVNSSRTSSSGHQTLSPSLARPKPVPDDAATQSSREKPVAVETVGTSRSSLTDDRCTSPPEGDDGISSQKPRKEVEITPKIQPKNRDAELPKSPRTPDLKSPTHLTRPNHKTELLATAATAQQSSTSERSRTPPTKRGKGNYFFFFTFFS